MTLLASKAGHMEQDRHYTDSPASPNPELSASDMTYQGCAPATNTDASGSTVTEAAVREKSTTVEGRTCNSKTLDDWRTNCHYHLCTRFISTVYQSEALPLYTLGVYVLRISRSRNNNNHFVDHSMLCDINLL